MATALSNPQGTELGLQVYLARSVLCPCPPGKAGRAAAPFTVHVNILSSGE